MLRSSAPRDKTWLTETTESGDGDSMSLMIRTESHRKGERFRDLVNGAE
jgi:hypothetical protein